MTGASPSEEEVRAATSRLEFVGRDEPIPVEMADGASLSEDVSTLLAALSTPPSDDVREALAFRLFAHDSGQDEAFVRRVWAGHPDEHPVKRLYFGQADALLSDAAFEVRPRGTVTEPTEEEVEQMRVALNAADIDYSAREHRADAGGGDMEPGDWFAFLARAALRAGAIAPREPVTDADVEAAARSLASLEPGEDWPSNGDLGGNGTGTRDDEYRDGLRDMARAALEAAREARS